MKSLILPLVLVWLSAASVRSQCVVDKIIPLDVLNGDHFGWSLDANGDVLAVGSQQGGIGSLGRAWMLRREGDTWLHVQTIDAGPGEFNWFAHSVATSGDVLVAGHPFGADGAGVPVGKVWVYRRTQPDVWMFEQILQPDDLAFDDSFGWAVAIDGDRIVVGAIGHECVASCEGAAWVYDFDGLSWQLTQKLPGPALGQGAGAGYSVAVDGDVLVVGQPFASVGGVEFAGAALVYRLAQGTWTLEAVLRDPDATFGSSMGEVVALDGELLVVGSPNADGAAFATGRVLVYRYNGVKWVLEASLVGEETAQRLGSAVAVEGDFVAVGDLGDTTFGFSNGASYLYQHIGGGEWVLTRKLLADDAVEGDLFGYDLDLDSARLYASERNDDDFGFDTGAVFVYDHLPAGPEIVTAGQHLEGAAGWPCLSGASTLLRDAPLDLFLDRAAPQTTTTLVVGLTTLMVSFKGGVFVPSPDVLVTGLPTDAAGGWELASTWPAGVPGGTVLAAQAWIVDAAGPKGLAASNGVLLAVPGR